MSGFQHHLFVKNDDYMTPKSAWEDIRHIIPKDKIIWEAFYGDGKSGEYLKELGFNVISEPVDFFENDLGDIIVTNPPFSQCKKILERLKKLDKPFILILPSSKINTTYVQANFANKDLQIVIPKKRIHFDRVVDGKKNKTKSSCNFDCFYYCYKLELPTSIVWLL